MATEGARAARYTLKLYQQCLNSPRLVPERCYRMSSTSYTLVNYVNQITGLFISKNYFPIPIFLDRAYKELSQSHVERVSEAYRKMVLSYLAQMAYFIVKFVGFTADEEWVKDIIPAELLALGEQAAPDIGFLPGEF